MKNFLLSSLLILLFFHASSQNNLPYPVIFVHGLAGGDDTFDGTMTYLRDHDNLGSINVFDVVLNADNDDSKSKMSTDVKWEDFWFDGPWWDNRDIYVGRRNYRSDIDDYLFYWTNTNIFAINFKEERIKGAAGSTNDFFDYSDQAGIFKQGYALQKMIKEVLLYTGAEKVILVGHSMGGLCIREYLQRTNSSGTHVNWIDPYSSDGHKVARVATYGTPHLGSNAGFDPTKKKENPKDSLNNKSGSPDENTEANRDLLWKYDSYTNCGGLRQGIYMFGGNEHCIQSIGGNSTFLNVDINCDGDEDDDIIGINESYYSKDYNPNMPLPLNIKYTYMTSIWGTWSGITGDGVVDIHRQWLHNSFNQPTPLGLTDTTLHDVFHTSEGGDYEYVIRGIDEPKRFDLAYKLKMNKPIIGYVTYQQGHVTNDVDVFKVTSTGHDAIAITIDGALSGVHTIGFYDASENMLCSRTVSTFPNKLYVNIPDGANEIYIKIEGTATNNTWRNPYTLNIISGSWEGSISNNWNSNNNWSVTTPDQYDDVFIPSSSTYMPIVALNANCNRMGIPTNSTLTINSDVSVNIHNDMKLDGTITLKADFINTASYLDNGIITGTGTVKLDRNMQSGAYHYISAHVNNGNSDVFTQLDNGYTNPNFYYYDETNTNPDWLYGWTQGSEIMQVAKGYAYYAPYEQTFFSLEGKPNTGNFSIPVTNTNLGITSDGWNLIGNPYPSAISAFDFINLNSSGTITGGIYLWDDDYANYNKEDYGVYNLSGYVEGTGGGKVFNGYIAAGQAFFVSALSSGNVNFNNSIRRTNNSVFFKNEVENNDVKRLYINISGNDLSNNILLAFTEEATVDFDILYDAKKVKINPNLSFYSILDDEPFIIQALPKPTKHSSEINLGMEIGIAGNYTFTIEGIEDINEDIDIYLKDNLLNEYVDLRETKYYTTNIIEGTDNSRFSIVFKKNATKISDLENDVNIFSYGNNIIINSTKNKNCEVSIYNINGKLIKQKYINGTKRKINMNSETGIYFVKVISDNKVYTKKVFKK